MAVFVFEGHRVDRFAITRQSQLMLVEARVEPADNKIDINTIEQNNTMAIPYVIMLKKQTNFSLCELFAYRQ